MNIMEIVSCKNVNGAILHCLLLSRELACRGNRVSLVCLPDSWIARQAACDPVRVITSDLHRWPTDELRRIAAVVHEEQIDVVHTHTSRAQFFGVLLRYFSGVPTVATAHSRHFQLHWMFNDQVIAVSDATRRYQRVHNFVRPGRIETIHNFVDYRCLTEVPRDAHAKVRASLGIADSVPLVGVVGDVIPRKGLIYLIGAMPTILASVPEARLVVVGGTTNTNYVSRVKLSEERLGVADSIIWAGHRSNVHEVLTALDICVLPSLEESLPLAILEAMAAGLPVVATTVGGIPECVVSGTTGTLVPPADSEALAEAVIALLRDPVRRRKFGEAGRKRAREEFSPESQVPRVEAVFARVTRRRRAA